MKMDEEIVTEIVVVDSDSESGAEASNGEEEYELFLLLEEEQQQQKQHLQQQLLQLQASVEEDKPQAGTSCGGIPTWGPPQGRNTNIHPFVGPARGMRKSEASHINKDSSPLAVLMLFFAEIFQLLVEQTNMYYQQYLDRQAEPSRQLPDITLQDMMTFIALALQMGHDVKDTLHDYWSRLKQLHTPFYGETMTRDRFLHILRFLHFADNSQRPDEGEEYDQLWKLGTIFDTLNQAYAKFYNPSEHLAVDEVIVKFKGMVIFRRYIPRARKRYGIKIYKLCDELGYTYDMRLYLGQDTCSSTDDMTVTHATVRHLTHRVEGLGHKIFMDSFFTSPTLFDDLETRKINSCGTVRPDTKDMPPDFGPENLKLKRGDIRVKTRGGLTALVWKDRQEVYMLTNMDPPPAEGNFCDDRNHSVKPHIVERYNRHMGYVDSADRMANSYSICRRNFKWTTKLFFHLLDLTVLNSWILLSSCGAKHTHRDFRLLLVRNLIEEAGRSRPTPSLVGRQSAAATDVARLESRHNKHWPVKSTKVRCRVCSARGHRSGTIYKCAKCDVGLCVVPCFAQYHTEVSLNTNGK